MSGLKPRAQLVFWKLIFKFTFREKDGIRYQTQDIALARQVALNFIPKPRYGY